MKNKRLILLLSIASALLLLPLIAMSFSNEVRWSAFDFIIMGALLFSAAFAIELVLRRFSNRKSRIICSALILLAFLLIWAELAVGIFGTPFAGS